MQTQCFYPSRVLHPFPKAWSINRLSINSNWIYPGMNKINLNTHDTKYHMDGWNHRNRQKWGKKTDLGNPQLKKTARWVGVGGTQTNGYSIFEWDNEKVLETECASQHWTVYLKMVRAENPTLRKFYHACAHTQRGQKEEFKDDWKDNSREGSRR